MPSINKEHPRIRREKKTIKAMMDIYCAGHHGTDDGSLCHECSGMLEFAMHRLDKCRYQERKPTCGNCPVHCYPKAKLEQMEQVMMYAGPRMSYRHPVMALRHFMDSFRKVPEVVRGKDS